VPQVRGLLAEFLDDGVVRIVVAVGTGNVTTPKLHAAVTPAISKSSVTGSPAIAGTSRAHPFGVARVLGVHVKE